MSIGAALLSFYTLGPRARVLGGAIVFAEHCGGQGRRQVRLRRRKGARIGRGAGRARCARSAARRAVPHCISVQPSHRAALSPSNTGNKIPTLSTDTFKVDALDYRLLYKMHDKTFKPALLFSDFNDAD